jgi:hypothetical protein
MQVMRRLSPSPDRRHKNFNRTESLRSNSCLKPNGAPQAPPIFPSVENCDVRARRRPPARPAQKFGLLSEPATRLSILRAGPAPGFHRAAEKTGAAEKTQKKSPTAWAGLSHFDSKN